MLTYGTLKRDRRKFLALTGLTLTEFKALLHPFTEGYRRRYAGPTTPALDLMMSGTPVRMGWHPVSIAAREGEQVGEAADQLVKRTPEAARASMLGVLASLAP